MSNKNGFNRRSNNGGLRGPRLVLEGNRGAASSVPRSAPTQSVGSLISAKRLAPVMKKKKPPADSGVPENVNYASLAFPLQASEKLQLRQAKTTGNTTVLTAVEKMIRLQNELDSMTHTKKLRVDAMSRTEQSSSIARLLQPIHRCSPARGRCGSASPHRSGVDRSCASATPTSTSHHHQNFSHHNTSTSTTGGGHACSSGQGTPGRVGSASRPVSSRLYNSDGRGYSNSRIASAAAAIKADDHGKKSQVESRRSARNIGGGAIPTDEFVSRYYTCPIQRREAEDKAKAQRKAKDDDAAKKRISTDACDVLVSRLYSRRHNNGGSPKK